VLSKRLPALKDGAPVSVINMGIGSNRLVSADAAGPAGLKRLEDDVLSRPNVSHLILLEGINDISYEQAPAEKLISAYEQVIDKAHAKGIKVIGVTLLPIQNSRKDTPANEATRQAVNMFAVARLGKTSATGASRDMPGQKATPRVVGDPRRNRMAAVLSTRS